MLCAVATAIIARLLLRRMAWGLLCGLVGVPTMARIGRGDDDVGALSPPPALLAPASDQTTSCTPSAQ